MTLREQLSIRERQWAAFHRWEAVQPLPERDPAEILADVGAIWNWLPPEVRTADPDPCKLGIQKMRAALAHLHWSAEGGLQPARGFSPAKRWTRQTPRDSSPVPL